MSKVPMFGSFIKEVRFVKKIIVEKGLAFDPEFQHFIPIFNI
jgi:hypothetical protein